MTHYECGSCSFRSEQLDEAQHHSQQSGHICVGKENAAPLLGKFRRAGVVAMAGAGVLAAGTIGALAWKCKELQEEKEELQTKNEGVLSMAAGLAVQLAESLAENDYLKSATGAAKTLKSYDR
ncbi:hypothetical protein [Streptomyces racemochromogenes]|uniref:hypothetical protein n=1 Tax=Streptomyces racemochromogenes TaxID=67353 RepID=UPI0035E6AD70